MTLLRKSRIFLREIERRSGRIRGEKTFDSRILDIDIILFGQSDLRSTGMDIPRLEIEKYAYVLKPLSDLYPEMRHPVSGHSFAAMWEAFEHQSQKLRVSDFRFRY